METILVTGGAGYVGSHIASELLESGKDVVVFDNLSTGHFAAIPQGAAFVEGDLRDPCAIGALFRRRPIAGIIHCAGLSLVSESMADPMRYLGDNLAATANLVKAAAGCGCRRIVMSSTANLFGIPSNAPLTENSPIEPASPYGESKYFMERLLAWAERLLGMRHASLRYFNAAGADLSGLRGEDHRPETHLIPNIFKVALGQKARLEIYGSGYPTADGTCVRDYIHVLDLAQAHLLALEALKERTCLRYNLGNGTGHTVAQVIEVARDVTGHPIPAVHIPARPGDPAVLVADSARAGAELGWRPRFSHIETILTSAWRWHRTHPHGYAELPSDQALEMAAI